MQHPFLPKTSALVIDVSLHQGNIDWDAVRAGGVKGAVVKAGQTGLLQDDGSIKQTTFVDPKFKRNQEGARRTMRRVGYYYWMDEQGGISPTEQARFFVKTVGPLADSEFMVLDYERRRRSKPVVIAAFKSFLDEVERLTGKVPWIYASPSLVKEYDLGKHFTRHAYWPAHWGVSAPRLVGWKNWALWQTGVGKVPGISGDVDVNQAPPSFFGVTPLRAAALLVLGVGAGKLLLDRVG